jgi:hypothetical protein
MVMRYMTNMRDQVRVHGSGCVERSRSYTISGTHEYTIMGRGAQTRDPDMAHAVRGCVTHEHVSGYAVHGSRMRVMRRAGQRDAHRARTSAVLSFENVGVPGILIVKPYPTLPGYLVLDKNFPGKI